MLTQCEHFSQYQFIFANDSNLCQRDILLSNSLSDSKNVATEILGFLSVKDVNLCDYTYAVSVGDRYLNKGPNAFTIRTLPD